MGDLCAWITLATERKRVEKRRTSPVWGVEDAAGGWEAFNCVSEDGEGTGDGYARYELSEEGDNATIAVCLRV